MIPKTGYKALGRKTYEQPASATTCVNAHLTKDFMMNNQPKLFSLTRTAHLVFAKVQVHLISLVLEPSQEMVCRINDAARRESLARWWPRYFGTPVKLDHEMEVIQLPTTGTRHGQYDGVGRLVVIERGMNGQAFAQAFARLGLP